MAEPLLVFAGSVAAAFAGLVAEDFFPGREEWLTWCVRLLRIGCLLAATVLAWLALRRLRLRRRLRGTLYYLRMQSDTNDDYHSRAINQASKDYLGFRAMAAWCDPGTGIVDVRDHVTRLSTELQRSTNDDADDSGFDIAPNLIFPVALGVGYDWIPPGPGELRLREFSTRVGKENLQDFEWRLGCLSAAGAAPPDRETGVSPPDKPVCGQPECRTRHFRVNGPAGRVNMCAVTDRLNLDTPVRAVWLEYWLTASDYTKKPFLMESQYKASAQVTRIIRVEVKVSAESAAAYTLLSYTDQGVESEMTVRQIAEGAAYWLGETLREYPDATVFVAGGMPKTVALAMGYLMTRPPLQKPAAHPWRRIVPMGYFLGEPDPLRPMWVRPDQCDPDQLIAQAGLHP
ncbi:hypothetical protein [Micropruina sp.]|uniref:hypothetical protein n=1 Tax=Micropruina sp. TaxID=2737536 RepID=UPI0039E654B2